MTNWTREAARHTYNIAHWSGGYFDINAAGHLCVKRNLDDQQAIDFYQLCQEITEQGLSWPVLVRFPHILHHRVDSLCQAFNKAIANDSYTGKYTLAYPIKVNQQRSVVEQIYQHGRGRVGLEAGSKPELMAVLALTQSGDTIICNGYKDREYIRLALIGLALGQKVYIVIEKPSELNLVIEESKNLNIAPMLGVRLKLSSIGVGKWQNSGGEKSKFGLTAAQLLQSIEQLRQAQLQDSLKMLHFHLGSQIPNIRDVQRGMRECARYYAELHQLGVNIDTVDVGGGLGIDYEGTRSRHFCSINYNLDEYAHNIVHTLWEVCEEQGLPHPNLISESGRALTAHHAALITNIIDTAKVARSDKLSAPSEDEPLVLHDMWQRYQSLLHTQQQPQFSRTEIYHDIHSWITEIRGMYLHGVVNIRQYAHAEDIFYACCQLLLQQLKPNVRQQRAIIDELNQKLVDKYFCNFSIFQSLPDIWAIEQIFPIMPLHRLNEEPLQRGVIEDITCDSDGRIDHYVEAEGIESNLALHDLIPGQPYLIGMFLVGAYQEILGDMHNLFGDTDSIDIEINSDGSYQLARPLRGDTVDAVLRYVQFDVNNLLEKYQHKLDSANLPPQQKTLYLNELENGLTGYTYLEE